jgi:tRNA(Arg) A34 adenosine deaminase TadA
MKKWFVLCLFLFASLRADISSIVEERHELFVLGVLSYLHNQLEIHPKPGWDIAALIALDVENVDHTPEFVIDRNRNFEKQGNIFHAEIMAIEKAALKKKSVPDSTKTIEEFHQQNSLKLTKATLYSSLEPCPMCTLGITWARIPQVIYFMEDPTTRDKNSYDPVSLPREFCGRTLTQRKPSSLPLALKTNQELRALHFDNPDEKYVTLLSDGKKGIDFGRYFKENQEYLLKLAYELFCSYEIKYEQNRDLYKKLLETVN